MFSVVISAWSISVQNATRGQEWELEDAARASLDCKGTPPRKHESDDARHLEGERADLADVASGPWIAAALGAVSSFVAVPCRRARGTWRRKPFEVAEEVAFARSRVE